MLHSIPFIGLSKGRWRRKPYGEVFSMPLIFALCGHYMVKELVRELLNKG